MIFVSILPSNFITLKFKFLFLLTGFCCFNEQMKKKLDYNSNKRAAIKRKFSKVVEIDLHERVVAERNVTEVHTKTCKIQNQIPRKIR